MTCMTSLTPQNWESYLFFVAAGGTESTHPDLSECYRFLHTTLPAVLHGMFKDAFESVSLSFCVLTRTVTIFGLDARAREYVVTDSSIVGLLRCCCFLGQLARQPELVLRDHVDIHVKVRSVQMAYYFVRYCLCSPTSGRRMTPKLAAAAPKQDPQMAPNGFF
jgi:hypothetical protein